MDSNLKRLVILLAAFLCLTVLLIVGATNYNSIKKKLTKNTATSKAAVSVSTDEIIEKDSRQIGNNLYAWKSDDTFFDNEASTLAAKLQEEMKTLRIKVVSVEGDIRVRVLDYQDDIFKGVPFEVSVTNSKGEKSTLEDSDKDGILYADELDEGEYTVALMQTEGYIVPDYPVNIKVYSHVRTEMIEDIELLIKEKHSSEAAYDDLMSISAEGYADKKQNTKFGKDESITYGIDLSSKNGAADFSTIYKSGIKFVMLRAGYRGAISGDLVVDESFEDNAHGALRAGLDVGVLFDSQAVNAKEAVEEASVVLKLLESVNITYPVAIRLDTAGGVGRADALDEEARTEVAKAFLDTIKSAGYDTMVYASSNWLTTNVDVNALERYGIWMAEFKKNIETKNYWYDMWQYTSQGEVPGVEGKVSLSISYIED